ncbi:MAG: hypothetical protein GY841_24140 [FCB group bacterium]|nr:hypothetical protein [FCB group bacterium]
MPKRKRKQKKIMGMVSEELSIVDMGANLKGAFPITKNKGKKMEINEVLKAVLDTADDTEESLRELITKSALSDEGATALTGMLRIAKGFGDQLPADVLTQFGELIGLQKAVEPTPATPATPDEPQAGTGGENEGMEMTDEVKKQFDTIEKAYAKKLEVSDAKIEKLEKALTAEQDTRKLEAWTSKVEKNLGAYPGTTEELAKQLFDMDKIPGDYAEKHFEFLKKAAANFEKSALTNAIGSDTAVGMTGKYQGFEKSLKEIKKANPDMSAEDAEYEAWKANPADYDQSCRDQGGN